MVSFDRMDSFLDFSHWLIKYIRYTLCELLLAGECEIASIRVDYRDGEKTLSMVNRKVSIS